MAHDFREGGERSALAPTSYSITAHYDRGEYDPGLLSLTSVRLHPAAAIEWILEDVPAEAARVALVRAEGRGPVKLIELDLDVLAAWTSGAMQRQAQAPQGPEDVETPR